MSGYGIFLIIFGLYWKIGEAIDCKKEAKSTNTQSRLMNKLFCGSYDKTERPVNIVSETINVTISLILLNYDFVSILSLISLTLIK